MHGRPWSGGHSIFRGQDITDTGLCRPLTPIIITQIRMQASCFTLTKKLGSDAGPLLRKRGGRVALVNTPVQISCAWKPTPSSLGIIKFTCKFQHIPATTRTCEVWVWIVDLAWEPGTRACILAKTRLGAQRRSNAPTSSIYFWNTRLNKCMLAVRCIGIVCRERFRLF